MKSSRRIKRAARHLFRACLVDGGLDEGRARFVAGRLREPSGRGALAILSSFQRLVRLDRDRHTAFVESATPLAGPMRERVHRGLARAYGAEAGTAFRENPAATRGR